MGWFIRRGQARAWSKGDLTTVLETSLCPIQIRRLHIEDLQVQKYFLLVSFQPTEAGNSNRVFQK